MCPVSEHLELVLAAKQGSEEMYPMYPLHLLGAEAALPCQCKGMHMKSRVSYMDQTVSHRVLG